MKQNVVNKVIRVNKKKIPIKSWTIKWYRKWRSKKCTSKENVNIHLKYVENKRIIVIKSPRYGLWRLVFPIKYIYFSNHIWNIFFMKSGSVLLLLCHFFWNILEEKLQYLKSYRGYKIATYNNTYWVRIFHHNVSNGALFSTDKRKIIFWNIYCFAEGWLFAEDISEHSQSVIGWNFS